MLLTSVLLVTLASLAPFLPVYAQEAATVDESISESVSTTTSTSTDAIPLENTSPYPTEPLLGDAVYGDFVVGPGKIEVEIEPGQSKVVQMTVANRTGNTRTFRIS